MTWLSEYTLTYWKFPRKVWPPFRLLKYWKNDYNGLDPSMRGLKSQLYSSLIPPSWLETLDSTSPKTRKCCDSIGCFNWDAIDYSQRPFHTQDSTSPSREGVAGEIPHSRWPEACQEPPKLFIRWKKFFVFWSIKAVSENCTLFLKTTVFFLRFIVLSKQAISHKKVAQGPNRIVDPRCFLLSTCLLNYIGAWFYSSRNF